MTINEYWEGEWNRRIKGEGQVECNTEKAEIILTNIAHRKFFNDKQILDIGCGPAFHALRIAQEKPDYKERWYGIDLSPRAVEFFKSHGLQGEHGSIYEFTSNGRKFDVFLLLDTLEHISDRNKLAEKINELSNDKFIIFGNIPLYIDKKDLESGMEHMMNINVLVDFIHKAGCQKLDHYIYGVRGYPYMIWSAYA